MSDIGTVNMFIPARLNNMAKPVNMVKMGNQQFWIAVTGLQNLTG